MKRPHVAATIVIVILASFVGCGKGKSVPTGTINGKLTLNGGSPGDNTVIQFMSEAGSTSAEVATDGSFSIQGAAVGSYQVMVIPGASGAAAGASDPEAAMKMVSGEGADGKGSNPDAFNAGGGSIPLKYTDVATSGVTLDVKEGDNTFSLDMKE